MSATLNRQVELIEKYTKHLPHRQWAWCRTSTTSCRAGADSRSYEPRRPWNDPRLRGVNDKKRLRIALNCACCCLNCSRAALSHHRPTRSPHTPRRPATAKSCHWQSSSQTAGRHTSLPDRNREREQSGSRLFLFIHYVWLFRIFEFVLNLGDNKRPNKNDKMPQMSRVDAKHDNTRPHVALAEIYTALFRRWIRPCHALACILARHSFSIRGMLWIGVLGSHSQKASAKPLWSSGITVHRRVLTLLWHSCFALRNH